MANYGYLPLTKSFLRIPLAVREIVFSRILQHCVRDVLDERWQVAVGYFYEDGNARWVYLPQTSHADVAAAARMLAPGEDVGFPVALQDDHIVFRHGPNKFERWAQGRVEEQLSDFFGVSIWYDATSENRPPGTRYYRRHDTFRAYLESAFQTPLTQGARASVDRYEAITPKGHW